MLFPRRVALTLLATLLLAAPAGARRHPHGGPQVIEPSGSKQAPTGDFFIEPDDGIRPVIGALESANHSIDLVVYLLSDDRILSALQRAHDRGVAVRVLLEPHPYGGGQGNVRAFERLRRGGIDVKESPARFHFTHEKAFVIDRALALITTANFTRSAFSRNREYGYFDRQPAEVREIEAMFDADWQDRAYTPHEPRLVVSPSNSRAKIRELLQGARHTIAIQVETFSDPELTSLIADQIRLGLHVTVQVEEAKDVAKLTARGIPARRLDSHYLHAKAIVVDGTSAFMGSENLTANSLDHNRELGLIFTDPAPVNALWGNAGVMRADWGP